MTAKNESMRHPVPAERLRSDQLDTLAAGHASLARVRVSMAVKMMIKNQG